MSKKDYYEILGVSRTATAAEIKAAYRKKAMEYHPDRNHGNKAAEEKFKELTAAYEVLSDAKKRASYDHYGHQDPHAGFGQGGFGFQGNFEDMADIFDHIFGGRAHGGRSTDFSRRGEDIQYDLEITLEEAFSGLTKEIHFKRQGECQSCHGSGAEAGTKKTTCPTCHGQGKVRMQQGFFMMERTCSPCQGTGHIIKHPCPDCKGVGRKPETATATLTIPAGIEDGIQIRLSGQGHAGMQGGKPGDLYAFLTIKPHALFQRNGFNIECRIPITMTMAALGGTIEIPTIDGKRVELAIPAGTQPGEIFRLKGKGMTIYGRTTRGDMHVQAVVEIPRKLTEAQIDLLTQFEEEVEAQENHPSSSGFWDKVKSLWQEDSNETPPKKPKNGKKKK